MAVKTNTDRGIVLNTIGLIDRGPACLASPQMGVPPDGVTREQYEAVRQELLAGYRGWADFWVVGELRRLVP